MMISKPAPVVAITPPTGNLLSQFNAYHCSGRLARCIEAACPTTAPRPQILSADGSPEGVGSAQPPQTRCSIEVYGDPPGRGAAIWRPIRRGDSTRSSDSETRRSARSRTYDTFRAPELSNCAGASACASPRWELGHRTSDRNGRSCKRPPGPESTLGRRRSTNSGPDRDLSSLCPTGLTRLWVTEPQVHLGCRW